MNNPPPAAMDTLRTADMEHRWGIRRPIDLDVQIIGHAGRMAPGWLRDLSLSGAFVRTPLVVPVMSTVRVVPRHRTEGWPAQNEMLAYVVRADADGLGLEWWDISLLGLPVMSAPERNMLDR